MKWSHQGSPMTESGEESPEPAIHHGGGPEGEWRDALSRSALSATMSRIEVIGNHVALITFSAIAVGLITIAAILAPKHGSWLVIGVLASSAIMFGFMAGSHFLHTYRTLALSSRGIGLSHGVGAGPYNAGPCLGQGTVTLTFATAAQYSLQHPEWIAWSYVSGGADTQITMDYTYHCRGDIVPSGGDGQIGIDDLMAVINAWGVCESFNCPADVAPQVGNHIVDIDDLLTVINRWGECQ